MPDAFEGGGGEVEIDASEAEAAGEPREPGVPGGDPFGDAGRATPSLDAMFESGSGGGGGGIGAEPS
eukprot:SAG22_NODE_13428_length_407_cov_0.840909_1_plen_66_part_01